MPSPSGSSKCAGARRAAARRKKRPSATGNARRAGYAGQAAIEVRKQLLEPAFDLRGCPTKRDRRRMKRFTDR